jgi:hypothetical protein
MKTLPEREAFINSTVKKSILLTNLVKIKFTDQRNNRIGLYFKIRKGLFGTGILRQRYGYWYT